MSVSRLRRARARRAHGAQRGFALFLALLVLLVVTISGIALLFNTQIEQSLSSTETKISRAFYGADSGLSWAAEGLRSNANFKGGSMPNGMSSNIIGLTTSDQDIQVVVTAPIVVGYARHPGDQINPSGGTYGTGDIVENYFHLSSTATSTKLSAMKTVTSDIGI